MSDGSKTEKLELENLELNRETLQDLTPSEAEGVEGGFLTFTKKPKESEGPNLSCLCGPALSDRIALDCVQRQGGNAL